MPLTLRLVKGSELTYAELDGNFTFITSSFLPLSGTSSMSAATASNITPAIASNADNRIITSDGDGTFTAEANFTFNGTSALLTGSLTVSGSNTLTNIGPARFRGNVANSTTVTAMEITGSSKISGSLVITGSLRVGNDYSTIDTTVGVLGYGPRTSVEWVNRFLIDSAAEKSADWESRTLNDSSAVTSVDWTSRALYDTNGVPSIDWDGRGLFDSNEIRIFNWETKRFRYSNGNSLLNFETPGTAVMFVSQSFTVSASGQPNATASISMIGGVSGDWYDIALRTSTFNGYQSSSIEVSKYITLTPADGFSTIIKGIFEVMPGPGSNNTVRIYNNSGSTGVVQIDPPTTLQSTLTVAGDTRLVSNVRITGSLSISGSGASVVIMPKVSQSLNFVDDAAAAAAGVPLGGLYRNGSFIMIRVS